MLMDVDEGEGTGTRGCASMKVYLLKMPDGVMLGLDGPGMTADSSHRA